MPSGNENPSTDKYPRMNKIKNPKAINPAPRANPNFKSFSYPLRSRPIDFNGLRSINRMKSHTHNITDKNSMILRGKKKLI